MNFRIYPKIPSAPIDGSPIEQEAYHFNLVQSGQTRIAEARGKIREESMKNIAKLWRD